MSRLLEGVMREVEGTITHLLGRVAREGPAPCALLDVGCWDGVSTERYARRLGCAAFGVEIFEAQAKLAEGRGIEVARMDLESGRFPWADGSIGRALDLVGGDLKAVPKILHGRRGV